MVKNLLLQLPLGIVLIVFTTIFSKANTNLRWNYIFFASPQLVVLSVGGWHREMSILIANFKSVWYLLSHKQCFGIIIYCTMSRIYANTITMSKSSLSKP